MALLSQLVLSCQCVEKHVENFLCWNQRCLTHYRWWFWEKSQLKIPTFRRKSLGWGTFSVKEALSPSFETKVPIRLPKWETVFFEKFSDWLKEGLVVNTLTQDLNESSKGEERRNHMKNALFKLKQIWELIIRKILSTLYFHVMTPVNLNPKRC